MHEGVESGFIYKNYCFHGNINYWAIWLFLNIVFYNQFAFNLKSLWKSQFRGLKNDVYIARIVNWKREICGSHAIIFGMS